MARSDEDLRARLARLRREPPPAERASDAPAEDDAQPAPAPAPAGAAPALDRLRTRFARARARAGRGAAAEEPAGGAATEAALAARTTGPPAGLVLEAGPAGALVARETRAPAAASHGAWRLDAVDAADPGDFALLTGDAALADLDLRQAVFLDTETSGLDGGAGTYVYMVGLGWFEGDDFVVWQGFLQGPEEERAMLAAAAARIAAAPAIVSFFGKVFDRHRMEDKLRLHGLTAPFEGRPHLDLCFPCRRLTRGALPDARLQTMERHLVGLTRADDLPGALAPAAWFDYLAGRAHRLEGVFRHNLDDVRSLATLAAYLGHARRGVGPDGAPLAGPAACRALALGRALEACGESAAAVARYELAFAGDLEAALDGQALARARLDQARSLRRSGEPAAARDALERAAAATDDPALRRRALDALAKICEHDLGELDRALAAARELADEARVRRLVARGAR